MKIVTRTQVGKLKMSILNYTWDFIDFLNEKMCYNSVDEISVLFS